LSEATQLTQISDNTNYGAIAGRDLTTISGSGNQGYIAGGDLYLGDQYVVQETLYFEPDLKDVEPPAWTTTPKAHELVDVLTAQRLIVLAGQGLDDKTMVARHLAWLLREKLEPAEVKVREWYRSSDPQKIESAFHETATTILLLPQVQPHHVGHRLGELARLLGSRRNYAIVTTEGTRAEWGITGGSGEEAVWQELSWDSYYGRDFLAKQLLDEIGDDTGRLPEWIPRELFTGSLLADGLTVEEAASRLRQPERVRQFARWLREEGPATPRDLLARLDQLGGDRAAILQWYRQLERTDQLLALGLVLFDGLSDDQAFAALEVLVSQAWRQSDPNLPLFDYKDLARLGAYFQLSETGEDGARIETASRQKREAILQAAWELQRRRMLAVVPAMTRLIRELAPPQEAPVAPKKGLGKGRAKAAAKEAAADEAASWRFTQGVERELFSSPRRIEQLQRSVIESLSQIGLLSFEAVEASFLELAVGGSAGFQTVVAKALAAWRGEGHSEELFRVLRAWWEEGCIATAARSLAEQSQREGVEPRTAIRATVALTAGYALQYDRPNEPAPEILGLLEGLLQDAHPAVRARVLELTLPLATASHLQRLELLLRNRIYCDQEQMYAIAFGTAMAYSLRPAEALAVIARWQTVVLAEGPREPGDLTVTPRDRLLSAVALAYGYIRSDADRGPLTPDQIVEELRSILTRETHPFVRTHALMAMGLQAVDNFERVASVLIELISEVTLADRLHVISVLARAYLHQREQLSGGDEEVEIGGRRYDVWTRSARPLTTIETALYTWLRDDAHPVAQQVAIQTFAAIAATDLDQKEKALASRRPPPVHTVRQGVARVASNPPRLHGLGLFGKLAIRAATLRRRDIRPYLGPLLAEMVEVRRSERSRVFETAAAAAERGSATDPARQPAAERRRLQPAVMQRLHGAADAGLRSLGRSLSVALDVYRWRWAILLAAGVSAFLLVYDVQDWRWSLGSSMASADEDAVFQRGALPWRFAWSSLTPVRKQLEEERRRAEEEREKARIAQEKAAAERAARLAALAPAVPAPAPVIVASSVEPEPTPPPVPGPAERLPPMARFVVNRQPPGERSEARWLLLALLQALPRKPAPAAAPPPVAALQPPAAAATTAPVPMASATPAPARSAPSRAAGAAARSAPAAFRPATPAPQPEPAETAAKEETLDQPASFGAEPGAAPAEAEPSLRDRPARPEETPAPAKEPWWKRALKKTFKPRPPEGTPHGNG